MTEEGTPPAGIDGIPCGEGTPGGDGRPPPAIPGLPGGRTPGGSPPGAVGNAMRPDATGDRVGAGGQRRAVAVFSRSGRRVGSLEAFRRRALAA